MNRIPRRSEALHDMLNGIVKARGFVRYMSQNDFVSDERSVFAVAHALSIMSRSATRAGYSRQIQERYPNIPWETLKAASRRISHFYQTFDPNVIWRTVIEDLPPIEEELRRILQVTEADKEQKGYIRLIVDGENVLTAGYLESVVSPFIVALTDLQKFIDAIKGRKDNIVIVRAITYYSPVSVSLEGVADAATVVRDSVVGWRREHSKKLAQLVENEKATEIERQKAELLKLRAEAAKNREEVKKIQAEAKILLEEAERQRIENERLRFELQRDKVNFALDLLKKMAPNLTETEKITELMKLLPILETLESSSLQMLS